MPVRLLEIEASIIRSLTGYAPETSWNRGLDCSNFDRLCPWDFLKSRPQLFKVWPTIPLRLLEIETSIIQSLTDHTPETSWNRGLDYSKLDLLCPSASSWNRGLDYSKFDWLCPSDIFKIEASLVRSWTDHAPEASWNRGRNHSKIDWLYPWDFLKSDPWLSEVWLTMPLSRLWIEASIVRSLTNHVPDTSWNRGLDCSKFDWFCPSDSLQKRSSKCQKTATKH